MTTVESRVVNPVKNPAPVEAVGVTDTAMVEAAMQREEEKMIGDEEIDSCEAEDFEDKMLTVALVKSVVDSGKPSCESKATEGSRYGLRKRRRPSNGNGLGEASLQTTSETTALHQLQNPVPDPMRNPIVRHPNGPPNTKESALPANNSSNGEPPGTDTIQDVNSCGDKTKDSNHQTTPTPGSSVSGTLPPVPITAQPPRPAAVASSKANAPHPPAPPPSQQNAAASKPALRRGSAAKVSKKPSARKTSTKSQKAKKVTLKVPANATPLPRDELAHASGAVPNPLSMTPALPILPKAVPIKTEAAPQEPTANVPCPLPAPVPCPLGPDSAQSAPDVNVSSTVAPVVASLPPPPKRGRIFSVDLDPSTFDFTDMVSDYNDGGDKSENTDIPDPTGIAHSSDLAIFQRDRAFSFEVFNFSGDDLLPPPPTPASHSVTNELPGPADTSSELPGSSVAPEPEIAPVTTRPRGDSIIFDPASFQEGGIHEKNALLKVKASNLDGPPAGLLADSKLAAPQPEPEPPKTITTTPNPLPPATAESHAPPPASSSSEIATLPSSLSNNVANASSPATFQMELLNKDGRIGIYLPEARRQRIARFHAKRKMRIWRKRIKYDCRKKLADSRPRIKGRFVKRSDMDEE